jgi:hypothetical protein
VLVRLAEIWASVAVKMFSHLIYFIKKFYKCCTFNAICKDNAVINCVTFQSKKGSFPVRFDGSHYARIKHSSERVGDVRQSISYNRHNLINPNKFLLFKYYSQHAFKTNKLLFNINIYTQFTNLLFQIQINSPTPTARLTPWRSEQLLSWPRNILPFYGTRSFVIFSKEPTTGPYIESDEFNIRPILPTAHWSSSRSLILRLSDQNFVCISPFAHSCYAPTFDPLRQWFPNMGATDTFQGCCRNLNILIFRLLLLLKCVLMNSAPSILFIPLL